MSESKDKYIEAITQLIRLTREEKIKWDHITPLPSHLQQTKIIGLVYFTEYKNKKFILYKIVPHVSSTFIGRIMEQQAIEYWSRQHLYKLEIVDIDNIPLWTFPELSILSDLYEDVSLRVAKIPEFLDEILKEK